MIITINFNNKNETKRKIINNKIKGFDKGLLEIMKSEPAGEQDGWRKIL